MTPEFRDRVFLPLMLPLAILGGIAALVGGFAAVLLWNTRLIALILAVVAAGSVLAAVSLLSAGGDLSPGAKAVVLGAAVVPLLLGALSATGVIGAIPEEERNINREPHLAGPGEIEGSTATLIATEFAFSPSSGTLEADGIEFTIDNEGQVQHTFVIEGLEEEFKLDAQSGETDSGAFQLDPGSYVFYCDVPGHRESGMEGTLEVQ